MQFKILGPFEVLANGHPIPITAPKQKALLVRLLLSRGRVVSTDTLLDDVWSEDPPSGGAKTLQFHISKLRDTLNPGRALGEEGVVTTRAPGYAVTIEPDDLDAIRFERLVGDARNSLPADPERASRLFSEALSLWRGPALSDFEEPFVAEEIRRLEEQRVTALEDRIEADLTSGRHFDVVSELEELTLEHPFRERFWSQLMVALYRCDRQADALRVYRDLRQRLGDELGIEPSVETQALEEQILLHHEALKKPGVTQPPGGRLRGYELRQMLGMGALGLVWRANQPSVGRDVAIKVIRPKYANRLEFVRRFEAEARLVASLEHPHIVPIFDYWRDPDGAYLVMRMMERGGLDRATSKAWEPGRVLKVAEQVASALAYAHHRGVFHGDLHPGNVLLDGDDNAYLVDFGLAAHLTGDVATPPEAYASPEQRQGHPAGAESDVFGLGALMFRLLTGSDPPVSSKAAVTDLHPEISPAIAELVELATATEPKARFSRIDEFLEAIRSVLGSALTAASAPATNPYKGLRAFTEADSADFFGREALTEDLLTAVSHHRLVGVVGPSGSGKSSLVMAGLLPALHAGLVTGSERWLVTNFYPGEDPFARLAEALLSVRVEGPDDLEDKLRDPETGVETVAESVPTNGELLIVIDQFEELFALCPDHQTQVAFMDLLQSLATDPQNRVRIVLTLRADFYGRPLQYEPFGALLGRGVISITPPSSEELTRAIVSPASRAGIEVQSDLVVSMVGEVTQHSGGLPLMEYALTRLFEDRSGARITVDAYQRIGGIHGALGSWAEDVYDQFGTTAREATQQIYLRLTGVDEEGREARHRVPLPELSQLGIDPPDVDRVLNEYGNARLLTFDRDPLTRTPTVEIAHDALFREWDRLRDWIDSRREDLVLQRRFRAAVADWERSERDDVYLLQGGRLHQFETWAEETDLATTESERQFITSSRDEESRLAAQRRKRRSLIGAGLAGLALVAAGFGVAALVQSDRATEQRVVAEQQAAEANRQADEARRQAAIATAARSQAEEQQRIAIEEEARAEEQERIARARALAAAAVSALDTDPELSVLLATEAINATRSVDGTYLREAEEALHRAVSTSRLVAALPAERFARSLAFNPEGDSIYVGGFQTSQIAGSKSGEVVEELPYPMSVVAIAGVDDELLVVADFDGGIRVQDRSTLEDLFRLEGHTAWITDLGVARTGTLLASISRGDGMAYVWDLETREQIASFECAASECPGSVELSPDGSVVYLGSQAWRVDTGGRVAGWRSSSSGSAGFVRLLNESRAVVAAGSTLEIVDVATGEAIQELHAHTADVTDVAVSPDGQLVATSGRDGLIHAWELRAGSASHAFTLAGHTGTVWDVEFSPDGKYLASLGGSQDTSVDFRFGWPKNWETRVWDVSNGGSREWVSIRAQPYSVAADREGDRILVGVEDGAALMNLVDGTWARRFAPPADDGEIRVLASAGTLVVAGGTIEEEGGDAAGWVTVWDSETGEVIQELVPPASGYLPTDAAFNTDGTLLALADNAQVRAWDTSTWDLVLTDLRPTEGGPFAAVGLSPDGALLATQETAESPVTVRSVETGDTLSSIYQYPKDNRGAIVFHPSGRVLLTAGLGRPLLSEVYTGTDLVTLDASASYASRAAFSPDGTRIATAEADGTVRLWNTATGEELLILRGHKAEATDVAFSADGTKLASVSMDGTVRVWALDLDDLLDLAAARVTRGLSDDECQSYVKQGCAPSDTIEQVVPLDWDTRALLGISEELWEGASEGGSWQQASIPFEAVPILAYDQQSDRMLVQSGDETNAFGELIDIDLGILDPTSGTQEDTDEPSGFWASAVYHPNTDQIYVNYAEAGGFHSFDADSNSWKRLDSPYPIPQSQGDFPSIAHGPFGDYGQVMVADTQSDRIVLFGGANWGRIELGNHLGLDHTWIYDPNTDTWSESDSAAKPPPRVEHSMAYDEQSDRVILFGGYPGFASDGPSYGDTWAYDTNTDTWVDMDPFPAPSAREGAAMWYDPKADLVFLFGGTKGARLPWDYFGGEELWGYDYNTNKWTLFRVDPNPGYRSGSAVVLDEEAGVAKLFGGEGYDADRRLQSEAHGVWSYQHR